MNQQESFASMVLAMHKPTNITPKGVHQAITLSTPKNVKPGMPTGITPIPKGITPIPSGMTPPGMITQVFPFPTGVPGQFPIPGQYQARYPTQFPIPSGPTNVSTTCQQFAQTLGGSVLSEQNGVCTVMRPRNANVTVLGRPTKSPLVLAAMFSYESLDAQGNALCLGETGILQEEINPFIQSLRQGGITITALHNHWLFEEPRVMYIHWMAIDNPISFAQKVANAFTLLK